MIDVEAYITFLAAAFFTLLFFVSQKTRQGDSDLAPVLLGALTSGCWLALSLLWIPLVAASPTYQTYSVALLWGGFFVIFAVATIMDIFAWLKVRKWGEDVGEP